MKKILFLLPLLTILFSCSSDDSSKKEEIIEWIPKQIAIVNSSTPIHAFEYPHQQGCEPDFIRLTENNAAVFIEHEEGTCNIIETAQEWNRSGNQISFTIFDTVINGTIITDINNVLVIEADASQFTEIIILMYPDLASYAELINTMKVKITLHKK